jgi:hypothetical protein
VIAILSGLPEQIARDFGRRIAKGVSLQAKIDMERFRDFRDHVRDRLV